MQVNTMIIPVISTMGPINNLQGSTCGYQGTTLYTINCNESKCHFPMSGDNGVGQQINPTKIPGPQELKIYIISVLVNYGMV